MRPWSRHSLMHLRSSWANLNKRVSSTIFHICWVENCFDSNVLVVYIGCLHRIYCLNILLQQWHIECQVFLSFCCKPKIILYIFFSKEIIIIYPRIANLHDIENFLWRFSHFFAVSIYNPKVVVNGVWLHYFRFFILYKNIHCTNT